MKLLAEVRNLTELTKSVNLNNSALTGIVDRLESKGLVKRTKKDADRRTIYLEATEEGISYTAQLSKKMEDDCFFDKKKLTLEDPKEILATLDKIINSLDPDIKKIELNSNKKGHPRVTFFLFKLFNVTFKLFLNLFDA